MTDQPTFTDLPDGRGKVYVPQAPGCQGKHPCPDCFACQQCSPDRCQICRDLPPTPAPPHMEDEACR